ncbi:tyrosine-type recombinase/integrase [Streptococcus sp. DD04]|uniref:tyrosine-type recombinase/integrase n=1 Tax=Streptococcus sp. DD04 TaxID=1776578 RepID=UPI000780AED6|nr:site-specific integrase [Streptococcus sp. DD04]KXT65050.1 Integrase [Streptococcus sp. DD04]
MANIRYRRRGTSGLWSYEVREKGQTVAHGSSFKTKKEAIVEAEKIAQKIRLGGRLSKDMTLVSLYQEWLELKILPSNKSELTKQKYVARKKIILELFGNEKISSIRGSDYQRALNNYGERVGRDVLRRFHNGVKAALRMAIGDKLMVDDFTKDVELYPGMKEQETDEKYLHSEEEYFLVLVELRRRFDYFKSIVPFILYFLFVTGMRFGELMALTSDEVDFENNRIYTYRRYNTLLRKFVPPKNKTSIRHVPLKREDMELLRELIALQERVNKELGLNNPERLVFQHFSYKYGVPLTDTVNKYLREMLEDLEIEPLITTKGARHTYGSYLWHCGIDLGVIAKVLGHKDITMLIEVYGHTLEEKIDAEFDRIRSLKYKR